MTNSPINPPKTPAPNRDKENHGEATPSVNLPSALKLGTPFFRGTRRHPGVHRTNDREMRMITAKSSSTPGSQSKKSVQSPSNASTAGSESHSFPEELPLQLSFAQRLSLDKKPTSVEKQSHETEERYEVTKMKSKDVSIPAESKRQVRWTVPEDEGIEPPEQSEGANNACGLRMGGTVDACGEQSKEQKHASFESRFEEITSEPEDSFQSLDESRIHAPSEGDDFTAMIDAMAIDFQNEFEAEKRVLESLSSGRELEETVQSKTNIAVAGTTLHIDRLQKQADEERRKREHIAKRLVEQRKNLEARLREVQSHADLSVRLAREEAKKTVEEERLRLDKTLETMEAAQEAVVASAKREASVALESSRSQQDELRREMVNMRNKHANEIQRAVEKARDEGRKETEGSLSVQKAAVSQSYQREIFAIETELLETLDELDAEKEARENEKRELQGRIAAMSQELESEREKVLNATDGIQKEVEMFRIQLELEQRGTDSQNQQVGGESNENDNPSEDLASTVTKLQNSLREANQTIQTIKKGQQEETRKLEDEVTRLQSIVSNQSREIEQTTDAHGKLKEEYKRLTEMAKDYIETISFIQNQKSSLKDGLQSTLTGRDDSLFEQFSKLQEHAKKEKERIAALSSQLAVDTELTKEKYPRQVTIAKAAAFLLRSSNHLEQFGCNPTETCVKPVAVKQVPTNKDVDSNHIGENHQFVPIQASKNSAFCPVKEDKTLMSGRENPNALTISTVEKLRNDRESEVPSIPRVAENGISSEGRGVEEVETYRVASSSVQSTKVGPRGRETLKQTDRSRITNVARLGERRSGLAVPQSSLQAKPSSTRGRKSVATSNAVEATPDKRKNLSSIPRVASIARSTPKTMTSSISTRPSSIRETISGKAVPTPKPRVVLSKSSTPGVRRPTIKTGLPPRRASHLPQVKPPSRSKISAPVARSTPSVSKAGKAPSSATISRIAKSTSSQSPSSRIKIGNTLERPSPQNFATSSTRVDPVTPARSRDESAQREPSSQQVRDKFSSLCNTWSATKTPRQTSSPKELPQSLKLDFRLGASQGFSPASRLSRDQQRSLHSKQSSGKDTNMGKRAHQTPTRVPCFHVGDLSLHNDEDDEEDLLLSPTPIPVKVQYAPDSKTVESIVSAQAYVRSFIARKTYHQMQSDRKEKIAKVTTIQSEARRMLVLKRLRREKASRATIGQMVRKFIDRQRATEIAKQTQAVVVLQSYWRKCSTRRMFLNKIDATTRIQSFFRGTHARIVMKVKMSNATKHAAAVRIQTQWQLFRFKQSNDSATTIQNVWRRTVCMAQYRERKKSICKLQKLVRSFIQQRRAHRELEAATLITRRCRGFCTRRKIENLRNASVALQARQRGHRTRLELHKRVKAAVHVQTQWRRVTAMQVRHRKKEALQFMHRKLSAIVTIQTWIRSRYARRFYALQRFAAIRIQMAQRAVWRKQSINQNMMRRLEACIRIQSLVRSNQTLQFYCNQKKAAITVQAAFRVKRDRNEFSKFRSAAIKLQSSFRSKISLEKFENIKRRVILVQSVMRRSIDRRHYIFALASVETIQKAWRQHQDHKKQNANETISAVCIQSYYRAWISRRNFVSIRDAVETLQSRVRSRMERDHFRKIRLRAVVLQAFFRRNQSRLCFLKKQKSVTCIQRKWRLHHRATHLHREQTAAIVLQKFAREYLSRNRYCKTKGAINCIQRAAKAFNARRKHLALRDAAMKVQRMTRARMDRKQFRLLLSCLVKLQSWARCENAQRQYEKLRKATVVVQKNWRSHLEVAKFRQSKKAAESLQCWSRTCITRRTFQRKQYAANTIQTFWRSLSSQLEYKKTKKMVVKLQSWIRLNNVLRHSQLQQASAVKIQCIWHGFCARQATKKIRSAISLRVKKEAAAVRLQKFWRGQRVRIYCKSRARSATLAQSVFRKWRFQTSFKKLRHGVILLQSASRRKTAWASYQSKLKFAMILQKTMRGILGRRHINRQRHAVVMLQACARKYVARQRFMIMTIQAKNAAKPEPQHRTETVTPAHAKKRMPLSSLRTDTVGNRSGRQPLTSVSKSQSRRPLEVTSSVRKPFGDVTSVFSPVKTRGLKRGLLPQGQENQGSNIAVESPCSKKRKSEVSKPADVAYPRPNQMKVVELREALQGLGVRSKDIRKVRKAQLIVMLEEIQQGTSIENAVASAT